MLPATRHPPQAQAACAMTISRLSLELNGIEFEVQFNAHGFLCFFLFFFVKTNLYFTNIISPGKIWKEIRFDSFFNRPHRHGVLEAKFRCTSSTSLTCS